LSAFRVNPKDLRSQLALDLLQTEPIHVLRAGRCGDVASLGCYNERVGITRERGLAKVPFRADTDAGDGVRDKVVRPEVDRGLQCGEMGYALCWGGGGMRGVPYFECGVLDGRELWLAIQAGHVEEFSDGSGRSANFFASEVSAEHV